MRLLTAFLFFFTAIVDNSRAFAQAVAPQQPQQAPWFSHQKLENFTELRHLILELIGRAESRIVLYTDFLTDGEISSALFLAQYRKIQTVTFLGEASMNRYLSRVGYLKANNIPVFVRPTQSQFREPTVILIDRQLYRISRDLDVLKPNLAAEIQLANPNLIPRFENELSRSLKNNRPAIPEPLPMVGRSSGAAVSRQNVPRHYHGEADGSYNYDRASTGRGAAPPGVPTRLPQTTVSERRQRLQEQRQNKAKEATRAPSQDSPEDKESVTSQRAQGSRDFAPMPSFDRSTDENGSSEEWFDVD
jgi:hypothetical protein